jgi:GcrA cell cycle regulator
MTSRWSDEVVEQLRQLAESGLSASQAASHFEGMSRNSAVGIAFRQKFHFKGGNGSEPRKPYKPREKGIRIVVTEPKTQKQIVSRIFAAPSVPIDAARMLTLAQLGHDDCKWPYGDPSKEDFRYCGHARIESMPYCLAHCRMAYEPRPRR